LQTVSVHALSKRYGSTHALRDVSFEVGQGEVFALLGPNGAGKTSTLEILEGFRERDSGDVWVLCLDPGDRRTGVQLRSQIGVVLQELAVEPFLSVRQVLARNAGYYAAPRPIGEVIELIGLQAKADAKVKTLSGGQQRRLDVGLGIVGRFPIRHFITAVFQTFSHPGTSAWAGHDLLVIAIWGAAGSAVALRRFRWSPHRA
jgi:ABC-2 type transport system ATP-binding protein